MSYTKEYRLNREDFIDLIMLEYGTNPNWSDYDKVCAMAITYQRNNLILCNGPVYTFPRGLSDEHMVAHHMQTQDRHDAYLAQVEKRQESLERRITKLMVSWGLPGLEIEFQGDPRGSGVLFTWDGMPASPRLDRKWAVPTPEIKGY